MESSFWNYLSVSKSFKSLCNWMITTDQKLQVVSFKTDLYSSEKLKLC